MEFVLYAKENSIGVTFVTLKEVPPDMISKYRKWATEIGFKGTITFNHVVQ